MKKVLLFFVSIFLLASISFAAGFLPPEKVKSEIITFYNERINKIVSQLYLLEITNSEVQSNFMNVYFLEGKDPNLAKDINNYISSTNTPVMRAVFAYDYLKDTWILKRIDKAEGGLFFKVE